ncbi:MAG: hypothetical protein UH229_01850, partial [Lachnospiraceae bacterium]|nr:hypothetical protein [Lachnospiraceae bacterium]
MPNERNYLDDLPGVSGYAFGKFHLDDLDFADDPLKRKIDFIDDALLAPPKPSADITSGIKTSREMMGERKPQPTDKVGMRPEDYIRKKPAPSHVHVEPAPQAKKESAPSRFEYAEVKPARAPQRTADKNRTRPSGDALEEAYARYKERKQLEEARTQAANSKAAALFATLAGASSTARSGGVSGQAQGPSNRVSGTSYERAKAAHGKTKTAVRGRRSLTIVFFVIMAIVISAVMEIFSSLSSEFSSGAHEPSGFAGQTGGYTVSDEDYAELWIEQQDYFREICENPDEAKNLVGTTVYDIGITDEMIYYLKSESRTSTSKDDCRIYETEIGEYDIDYYEYEDYAWLRFWSSGYEEVASIALYYNDMVIQVVYVNNERVAELE